MFIRKPQNIHEEITQKSSEDTPKLLFPQT